MSLDSFFWENNLSMQKKLSKGYSSEVYLAKDNKTKNLFAAKIEKQKSPRENMLQKEVQNLLLANSLKIGPKLYGYDAKHSAILLEYIEGKTFAQWLHEKPSKKQLKKFVQQLLQQAKKLDKAKLSHGQLAGKGKNILVRKNTLEPVIIDFEKASQNRKPRNFFQLESFLFKNPHSAIAKKVRSILGINKS